MRKFIELTFGDGRKTSVRMDDIYEVRSHSRDEEDAETIREVHLRIENNKFLNVIDTYESILSRLEEPDETT